MMLSSMLFIVVSISKRFMGWRILMYPILILAFPSGTIAKGLLFRSCIKSEGSTNPKYRVSLVGKRRERKKNKDM